MPDDGDDENGDEDDNGDDEGDKYDDDNDDSGNSCAEPSCFFFCVFIWILLEL